MSTFKELSSKSAKTAFDKKVLSVVQHLHPYVKHRIYIAETTGIIPKNMYSSNGIIDECVIELIRLAAHFFDCIWLLCFGVWSSLLAKVTALHSVFLYS